MNWRKSLVCCWYSVYYCPIRNISRHDENLSANNLHHRASVGIFLASWWTHWGVSNTRTPFPGILLARIACSWHRRTGTCNHHSVAVRRAIVAATTGRGLPATLARGAVLQRNWFHEDGATGSSSRWNAGACRDSVSKFDSNKKIGS
jgi:hypothetical protein